MQLQPLNLLSNDPLSAAVIDGAREASNVLTRGLGRYVRVDGHGVDRVPLDACLSPAGRDDSPIVAVRMGITGDISGHVLLWLPMASAQYMAAALLGCTDMPDLDRDEWARSCIQESGTILASACLANLGTWLDLAATPATPHLAIGRPGNLIEPLLLEQSLVTDVALVAPIKFHVNDMSIGWTLYLLPCAQSMNRLERSREASAPPGRESACSLASAHGR